VLHAVPFLCRGFVDKREEKAKLSKKKTGLLQAAAYTKIKQQVYGELEGRDWVDVHVCIQAEF
jgi:hypothetical protein